MHEYVRVAGVLSLSMQLGGLGVRRASEPPSPIDKRSLIAQQMVRTIAPESTLEHRKLALLPLAHMQAEGATENEAT